MAAPRRRAGSDEFGRFTVLYPTVAEAARRAGADTIGLVDIGRPAALNLLVDRVGITYGDGPVLGDPSSPVQVFASVVGDRPVPALAVPPVVARVGVDRAPLDVTDPDDAQRLRARLPSHEPERIAQLEGEMALLGSTPPVLVRGNPVDVLPDAVARVPMSALPVVTTTWALSRFPPQTRLRFLNRLADAAADRPVAWVSVEGVGVAPGIPTLGDRPASGHSLIGLALFEGPVPRAETVGRCWSRGRLLSWLAGP